LGRVLSLGCGDGMFECLIASEAVEVVGADLSPKAIEAAQKRAASMEIDNVDFRVASADKLEFGKPFDTVIALAFLHHLPENLLNGYLNTFSEWLQPGGLFYSQDPNKRGVLRAIGRALLGRRYDTYHSPDERELDPHRLKKLVEKAGFEEVELYWIDASLIPASYIFRNGPDWALSVCGKVDTIWCRSPLGPWCSGFALSGLRED
jgi:cyclopropane fatty-acyl-phospholipid synthase-like methyltransferase